MSTSPQMTNLLARFGVTTERALLTAIAADQAMETGTVYTVRAASVLLDRMLDAEYERIESGAYEPVDAEPEAPCNCEVSRVYGGDCWHTAPERNGEEEPLPAATSTDPRPGIDHEWAIGPDDPRDLPF